MKKLIITAALGLICSMASANTTLYSGESFSKIKIDGSAKINIQQDSVCAVKYSGNDKPEWADATITNGTLTISGNTEHEMLVTLPVLQEIDINGHGVVMGYGIINGDNIILDIDGDGKITLNVKAERINADISGLGKIVLSGTAQEANYSIPGSGKIDASELKTIKSNVNISGLGKVMVDAVDELNSKISGNGTVTYKIPPKKINEDITGIGSVKNNSGDNYAVITTPDTTRFEWGKNQIWVIGNKDTLKYSKHKSRPIWAGFEMGINSYLDNNGSFTLSPGKEDFELRLEKSIYVALNLFQTDFELGRSNIWFLTGLGVTWNNYRFDNDVVIDNGEYITSHRDTTPNVVHVKSKLVASYITAPLMFEVFTSRNMKKAVHFDAGVMLGMRIGTHTKRKYDYDGNDTKLKEFDQFNLSPFRLGFRAAIGIGKFNVFADYYATTLFRENKGPVLYPVDCGITLVGF